jgi:hypothetical protein
MLFPVFKTVNEISSRKQPLEALKLRADKDLRVSKGGNVLMLEIAMRMAGIPKSVCESAKRLSTTFVIRHIPEVE